jgi:CRISPR-associated Csx3 family protein
MRVIVLRKQFEDTSVAPEGGETSLKEPEQRREEKPILLHIKLTTLIEPKELGKFLEVVGEHVPAGGKEPVIISGRLPVWAFSALVHYFHARPWVATFEPRLAAGIIVAVHVPGVELGQHFPIDEGSVETVEIVFSPERPKPAEPPEGRE